MTRAEEEARLEEVTRQYVADHRGSGRLKCLWMSTWDPYQALICQSGGEETAYPELVPRIPGSPVLAENGVTRCTGCGQRFVEYGFSGLHPGDPRISLLGIKVEPDLNPPRPLKIAVRTERKCPDCEGTILPRGIGGQSRGTCHCPHNV